jgi:hypothetical protein
MLATERPYVRRECWRVGYVREGGNVGARKDNAPGRQAIFARLLQRADPLLKVADALLKALHAFSIACLRNVLRLRYTAAQQNGYRRQRCDEGTHKTSP